MPARTLRAHAEPNSLSAEIQGPGSSRLVFMLSHAIWALFLSILIKKLGKKQNEVDPIFFFFFFFFLGGPVAPPGSATEYLYWSRSRRLGPANYFALSSKMHSLNSEHHSILTLSDWEMICLVEVTLQEHEQWVSGETTGREKKKKIIRIFILFLPISFTLWLLCTKPHTAGFFHWPRVWEFEGHDYAGIVFMGGGGGVSILFS